MAYVEGSEGEEVGEAIAEKVIVAAEEEELAEEVSWMTTAYMEIVITLTATTLPIFVNQGQDFHHQVVAN